MATTLMSSVSRELAMVADSQNLALGKLRKEHCQMFKARLNYIGTSGLAWATEDPCQEKKRRNLSGRKHRYSTALP